MTSRPPRSKEKVCATPRILSLGPTRIGLISPASAASTAPLSEVSSHGYTTAVASGGSAFAAAIRRSYFSCRRGMLISIMLFLKLAFSTDITPADVAGAAPVGFGSQGEPDLH